MPTPSPVLSPTRFLADALRECLTAISERQPVSAVVRVAFDNAETLELSLSLLPTGDSDRRLSATDEAILDVIDSMKAGERMTAKDLASKLKCEPHSRFRDRLTRLARLEFCESDRHGYGPRTA